MFAIPLWLNNILFLITISVAGFQHVQLRRHNPVTNLQFAMIVFAMLMIVLNTFLNRLQPNPWLSLGFCVIAFASIGLMIRQHRTLPPMKAFKDL